MDRRSFITSTTAAAAALAAGSVQASRKPNIIIILCDDLGWGDLGCFGSQSIATPNIDRLAAGGVRLTNFYASAAVCSPSRAGLLTGRYPVRTGINQALWPSKTGPLALAPAIGRSRTAGLPLHETTLAEAIAPAGYRRCMVGKWHLGDIKPFRPNHRGFERYLGLHYSNDMIPLPLMRNDEVVEPKANQDLLTRRYTEEAIGFIKEHREEPFLLYFAHTFPHQPLHASPEFRGRSKGGLYGDCVEEIDWSVGELLKTLDELGIADDTFIFFSSDNGPWYQGSPGGVRGRKAETFDGGMRVPGIARLPGVIPAGTVSHEPAMNFDLFTTALTLAGAPIPGRFDGDPKSKKPADRIIDGRDLMPMLRGGKSPHEALYFFEGPNRQAVRCGDWKYHCRHQLAMYPFTSPVSGPVYGPWLFNLRDDPGESYDCSLKYPEKMTEMKTRFDSWR